MAKKVITREMILNAAFELMRKEGASALSVRAIANTCNCSTQPIYLSFKGIDEIKSELYKMSLNYFYKFIENEIRLGKYPEYKSVGMGYVKFAREERELFKYLFMDIPRAKPDSLNDSFDKSVEIIEKSLNVSKEVAERLHTEMWIFGHGIATMYVTNFLQFDLDTVSELYTDVYTGIIGILGGKNGN